MKAKTNSLIQLIIFILGVSLVGVSCSNLFGGSNDAKKKSSDSWKWTVTFDGQGAVTEATPTAKKVINPALTIDALPTAPTKTGFNFAGWWTETNGGGTEFTASTQVKANLTVYANWSTHQVYTVEYNSDGGSAVGEQHVTLPETTVGTLPTVPTKANHTFAGWWTAINGGGTEFTATTPVTASVTVWAKWTINFNTVIYNSDGGSAVDEQHVTYPATTIDNLPAVPTKAGNIFLGWWTEINGGGIKFTASTPVTDNLIVWAKWLPESPVTWFVIDATNTLTGLSPEWAALAPTYPNKNNLVIPASVTSIKNDAFNAKTGLTSLFIPSSVTSLGQNAFYGCTNLASISIPSSITIISAHAFAYCSSLTSVIIPSSVTSIEAGAFDVCTGLTSITFPSSLKSIGAQSFRGCTKLTNIIIPSSVTSLGGDVFHNCTSLISITLSSSITSILNATFVGCTGLTSITIPSSVTSIGGAAFQNCTNLKTVILDCTTIPTVDSTSFTGNAATRKFKVPFGMLSDYQTTGVWETSYLSAIESQ